MKNLPKHFPAFEQLLSLERIEHKDLACLSGEEKKEFISRLYQKAAALKGKERDAFIEKTIDLLDRDFIWEFNHLKITRAVDEYVERTGVMPNKALLAEQCGLSRKTIHIHLKEFADNPAWTDQRDTARLMTQRLMGRVYKLAINGDLKATKMYMDYAGGLNGSNGSKGTVNNQNNFIRIDKTVFNQQVLQQLKPEQLKQIEQIIGANEQGNDTADASLNT